MIPNHIIYVSDDFGAIYFQTIFEIIFLAKSSSLDTQRSLNTQISVVESVLINLEKIYIFLM